MGIEEIETVTAIAKEGHYSDWDSSLFKSCFKEPYRNWVMIEGSLIVGFIIFWLKPDEVEILNLGILRSHQRKGLAVRLLKTCLQHSEVLERKKIFLEVDAGNSAAIALYGGQGFEVVGLRKNYYERAGHRTDAVIMRYSLEGRN